MCVKPLLASGAGRLTSYEFLFEITAFVMAVGLVGIGSISRSVCRVVGLIELLLLQYQSCSLLSSSHPILFTVYARSSPSFG